MVDSSLVGTPEQQSETTPHQVEVAATLQLVHAWGFHTASALDHADPIGTQNLIKILFEHGQRYVAQELKSNGSIGTVLRLELSTTNAKVPYPYDPARIQNPDKAVVTVEIETPGPDISARISADASRIFVDPTRIAELRAISSQDFDLTRLIRLCDELNLCYRSQCYLAVAMLTRAVIDHVPPIFGCEIFAQVANNYRGTKSFREQMLHLEKSSRTIADSHLHTTIRNSEVLPTETQVHFANDIDVLLAEIVRVLK